MAIHICPKDEAGLHEPTTDCLCEPELVEDSRLETSDLLRGRMVYEHNHFSPLPIQYPWKFTTFGPLE